MRALISALLILLAAVASAGLPAGALAAPVKIDHKGMTLMGNLELVDGKSEGDGVLLMVHGTLAHKDMEIIRALQQLLKERGVNTLAITLSLGIDARKGAFGCDQPMRHRHEDALEEIAAWVNWLKARGAKRIWLFGHSRGGAQVALYLSENPDPAVKRAVLLAPMTFDPQAAARRYEERFGAPLEPVLRQAANLARAGKGDRFMEVPGILYCRNARATPESFLSYHAPTRALDTPWLLQNRMKRGVPVLVIAGADDEVVRDLPRRMKEVSVPDVQFSVIDDADHFFRDFAAEDAADAIAEFLSDSAP